MTKSSKEYEDYINRNVKLIDGSKYYITNSGVAKKYTSESSWNNRHSSCKKVSDDPYELSVQNESGLQTNKPSLVLFTSPLLAKKKSRDQSAAIYEKKFISLQFFNISVLINE